MIKIFGKTIYGKSICVNVQDFYPYFYISIPDKYTISDCEKLLNNINI